MTHVLLPKNELRTAVLGREAGADYSIASTDPYPDPASIERGATLEIKDTGDRFRNTGVYWARTHTQGLLNVHDPDLDDVPFGLYFSQTPPPGPVTTLTAAAPVNGRTLTVASVAGLAVGGVLFLTGELAPIFIIAIVGNDISIDRFLDFPHPIGEVLVGININMAVNASYASPVSFRIAPPAGQIWHITRMLITMIHSSSGDLGKFGGIAELPNGVIGRLQSGGQALSVFSWKTNGDLKSVMYDVDFDARSGGSGSYGTSGRFTLTKLGTPATLYGDLGDYIEYVIQDDLSGLDYFRITAQGHLAEPLLVSP